MAVLEQHLGSRVAADITGQARGRVYMQKAALYKQEQLLAGYPLQNSNHRAIKYYRIE
jgi:hypothetical protein